MLYRTYINSWKAVLVKGVLYILVFLKLINCYIKWSILKFSLRRWTWSSFRAKKIGQETSVIFLFIKGDTSRLFTSFRKLWLASPKREETHPRRTAACEQLLCALSAASERRWASSVCETLPSAQPSDVPACGFHSPRGYNRFVQQPCLRSLSPANTK